GAVGIPLRIDTDRTAIKSYFTILDHDRNDNRLANELVDEGGPRVVVDLLWRPGLLDAALVHHHHTVGDFERLLLVVRDKERRNVDFGVKISEPAPQILAHLGIERAEGFVEKQDARLNGKRSRERDALPLAAGELGRVAAGDPPELHEVEQC